MSIIFTENIILNNLTQPLTHARIGWQNLARTGTVTGVGQTGFPAEAAATSDTYQLWRPISLPATWSLDIGNAADVDYIGIAAHTLGSTSTSVFIEYSNDNSNWTLYQDFTTTTDKPIMVIGNVVTVRYWRIRLTGSTAPAIGVIYIGKALAMQRPIYGGITPPLTPSVTTQPNMSEGGQYLGVSVIRSGQQFSASWEHLTAAWYRANFVPFIRSYIEYPAFVAWRPSGFPDEVVYMWSNGSLPEGNNMGVRDYMAVSLQGVGLGVSPDSTLA